MVDVSIFEENDREWAFLRKNPSRWNECLESFIKRNKSLFNFVVACAKGTKYYGVDDEDVLQYAYEEYIVQLKVAFDRGEERYPHLSDSVLNAVKRRLSNENAVVSGSFSTKIRKARNGSLESAISIDDISRRTEDSARSVKNYMQKIMSEPSHEESITQTSLIIDMRKLVNKSFSKDDVKFLWDSYGDLSIPQLAEKYHLTQRQVRYKKKALTDRLSMPARQAGFEAYL